MHDEPRPIVVVGSINMDLVSRVPAIPRVGQTIFGTDFQTHPGGKGANQAVGIARLAHPVKMIGMLGRDAFGKQLRDQLNREGVDTAGIGESSASTGTATILVDDAGQNCIVVTPGANLSLTPEILRQNAAIFRSAGIVLAQLEVPVETVLCLAEMCDAMRIPLVLDPAPAIDLPTDLFHRVSWFTPNETEAELYAGSASTDDALIETLFATGIRGLILKRGARGCIVVGEDRVAHLVPAPVVRAVDTTAAGDAFNAAFAVFLMRGHGPVESAGFASIAASLSVTRAGAQPSLATGSEVAAALSAEGFFTQHQRS